MPAPLPQHHAHHRQPQHPQQPVLSPMSTFIGAAATPTRSAATGNGGAPDPLPALGASSSAVRPCVSLPNGAGLAPPSPSGGAGAAATDGDGPGAGTHACAAGAAGVEPLAAAARDLAEAGRAASGAGRLGYLSAFVTAFMPSAAAGGRGGSGGAAAAAPAAAAAVGMGMTPQSSLGGPGNGGDGGPFEAAARAAAAAAEPAGMLHSMSLPSLPNGSVAVAAVGASGQVAGAPPAWGAPPPSISPAWSRFTRGSMRQAPSGMGAPAPPSQQQQQQYQTGPAGGGGGGATPGGLGGRDSGAAPSLAPAPVAAGGAPIIGVISRVTLLKMLEMREGLYRSSVPAAAGGSGTAAAPHSAMPRAAQALIRGLRPSSPRPHSPTASAAASFSAAAASAGGAAGPDGADLKALPPGAQADAKKPARPAAGIPVRGRGAPLSRRAALAKLSALDNYPSKV